MKIVIDPAISKSQLRDSKKDSITGPALSVDKFLNYLVNKTGNGFIVSHSSFLSQLTKKICVDHEVESNVYYDNLDILQIIMEKYSGKVVCIIVRRFIDNYYIENKPKYDKDNHKVFFLMRHCVALHNDPNLSALDKLNGSFGKYSVCFKSIIHDLDKVIPPPPPCVLMNGGREGEPTYNLRVLLDEYGGLDNVWFGSSIIFRAILTGILVYNKLFKQFLPPLPDLDKMTAEHNTMIEQRTKIRDSKKVKVPIKFRDSKNVIMENPSISSRKPNTQTRTPKGILNVQTKLDGEVENWATKDEIEASIPEPEPSW
jgi:hypothetical protein